MVKVAYKETLERILKSKKIELEAQHMNFRLAQKEHQTKVEMLSKDIDMLEDQLGK